MNFASDRRAPRPECRPNRPLLRWHGGKWLLAPSIAELAQLYDASFSLQGPSAAHGLLLVACGALLGWIGAFLSVSLSLRDPK